jgi:NAD(P)-dependent dehydrogenase (short-subunit alcohol dehydrogenase family)
MRTLSWGVEPLSGRTAAVTGAGSGIGRSIAMLCAARGATVHAADINSRAVESVVEQIRATGGSAMAHTVDVTDPDAVRRFTDDVVAVGPVHLLFNNAGIGHAGAMVDTSLEDWRRLVDVNLMGVIHCLHAFLPRMLSGERPAHIVNTASMAGLLPTAGLSAYSTTKAAVVGLSEALDIELAPQGVRVTALCPGIINTNIVRTSTMRGAWSARQADLVGLYAKHGTSPDVVARAALRGASRRRPIVATPRYQVTPPWLLKRYLPPASRALASLLYQRISRPNPLDAIPIRPEDSAER